jgi:hypothetical protein
MCKRCLFAMSWESALAASIGLPKMRRHSIFQTATARSELERVEINCTVFVDTPSDPVKKVPGVYRDKIDPVRSLEACGEAVRQLPNSPRVAYFYARALIANHRDREAVPFLKSAIQDSLSIV